MIDLALAIDSLPPIYRDALLMRDFEELTIEEMSDRLGVTREAAKSRLLFQKISRTAKASYSGDDKYTKGIKFFSGTCNQT